MPPTPCTALLRLSDIINSICRGRECPFRLRLGCTGEPRIAENASEWLGMAHEWPPEPNGHPNGREVAAISHESSFRAQFGCAGELRMAAHASAWLGLAYEWPPEWPCLPRSHVGCRGGPRMPESASDCFGMAYECPSECPRIWTWISHLSGPDRCEIRSRVCMAHANSPMVKF